MREMVYSNKAETGLLTQGAYRNHSLDATAELQKENDYEDFKR